MATLAQIFDRFYVKPPEEAPQPAAPDYSEAFRLRMFPNEDVYLFVKRIDNSHVVRDTDPRGRRVCWRVIGSSCAVALFFTGLLLPSVEGLLAGYRIEALRQENRQLQTERAALDIQESKLLATGRLQSLAEQQNFADPTTPEKLIYLNSSSDAAMAKAALPPSANVLKR